MASEHLPVLNPNGVFIAEPRVGDARSLPWVTNRTSEQNPNGVPSIGRTFAGALRNPVSSADLRLGFFLTTLARTQGSLPLVGNPGLGYENPFGV